MNIAFFLKPKSQVAYLHAGNTLRRKGIGENAPAGSMLAMLFNKFRRKAGLFCNMLHQFLVVKGNTQFLGN